MPQCVLINDKREQKPLCVQLNEAFLCTYDIYEIVKEHITLSKADEREHTF